MKHLISLCFAAALFSIPMMASAQTPQEVLAKFNHEPTVEATMSAAEAYAGLDAARIESLYKRAGAANVLPKSVYYELTYRDQDRDRPQNVYTFKPDADGYDSWKKTDYKENTDYLQHKVRAQWDLSKVIFNSDQLRVVSTMSAAAKSRDSVLKTVTKTYFARRKLQVDMMLKPPTDTAARLEAELKIQELTATLDALTGGWFSQQINKH